MPESLRWDFAAFASTGLDRDADLVLLGSLLRSRSHRPLRMLCTGDIAGLALPALGCIEDTNVRHVSQPSQQSAPHYVIVLDISEPCGSETFHFFIQM